MSLYRPNIAKLWQVRNTTTRFTIPVLSLSFTRASLLAELLVALQPMWVGPNLVFSFDLMSKFLVDMEALVDTKGFQLDHLKRLLRFLR